MRHRHPDPARPAKNGHYGREIGEQNAQLIRYSAANRYKRERSDVGRKAFDRHRLQCNWQREWMGCADLVVGTKHASHHVHHDRK